MHRTLIITEHHKPSPHLPVAPSLPLTHVLAPLVVTPLWTGLPFQFSSVLGVGLMAADYSQQYSKALLSRPPGGSWSRPSGAVVLLRSSKDGVAALRVQVPGSLQAEPPCVSPYRWESGANVSCKQQMPTVVELGLVMPERSLLRGRQMGGISGRRLGSQPLLHFSQPGSQVRLTWQERLWSLRHRLPNQGRLGSEG